VPAPRLAPVTAEHLRSDGEAEPEDAAAARPWLAAAREHVIPGRVNDGQRDDVSLVIAIDGPGGAGKSTVARTVATRLGLRYVDTGATYRALTWAALQQGVALDDAEGLTALAGRVRIELVTDPATPHVAVDGRRIDAEIRRDDVTGAVSAVSAVPGVRALLVARQQELLGQSALVGGAVVEGRDTASVVAPEAVVKVFLTADSEVRAARRAAEQGRGAVEDVARGLARRDALDSGRTSDPLGRAPGAILLDATDLDVDQVVDRVLALVPGHLAPRVPGDTTPRDAVRAEPGPAYRPWVVAVLKPLVRLLFTAAFRVTVRGTEHTPKIGPVLIAGNHSGFLDGPLVAAFAPREVRIVAKAELYHGAAGRFLHLVGQIPIHRGHPDRAALRAGVRVLSEGGVLGIFPEGTRGTGDLSRVQGGAAYLLLRAPAPVVPVVCVGTDQAMPKGGRPRWRSPVEIVFGPPTWLDLPAGPRSRSTVAAVAEQVRVVLGDHLATVRSASS